MYSGFLPRLGATVNLTAAEVMEKYGNLAEVFENMMFKFRISISIFILNIFVC